MKFYKLNYTIFLWKTEAYIYIIFPKKSKKSFCDNSRRTQKVLGKHLNYSHNPGKLKRKSKIFESSGLLTMLIFFLLIVGIIFNEIFYTIVPIHAAGEHTLYKCITYKIQSA